MQNRMTSASVRTRVERYNALQDEIDRDRSRATDNIAISEKVREIDERKIDAFKNAFKRFLFPQTTSLNNSKNEEDLKIHYKFGVTGHSGMMVYPYDYQLIFGRGPVRDSPAGYYVYKKEKGGIQQFFACIIHEHSEIEQEVNLSEKNDTNIISLLNLLIWPIPDGFRITNVWQKHDIKNFKRYVDSLYGNQCDKHKIPVMNSHVFWKENTAENFSEVLSVKLRKPHHHNNNQFVVVENGLMAKCVFWFINFFVLLLLQISSRMYGFNTILNPDVRRNEEGDLFEIPATVSAIACEYIKDEKNEEGVIENVRECYRNNIRL